LKIDVPDTWERRVEWRFTEPETRGAAVALAPQAKTAAPRTILTVTSEPADGRTLESARSLYLGELAGAVGRMKKLEAGPFRFDDGTEGVSLTVSFDLAPGGLRAIQHHAFRLDGGVLTQLTATVEERGRTAIEPRITAMMKTFRPT
jgi:hypothetical protein